MIDGVDFLLSFDLEDVRDLMPDGHQYRERVPAITQKLLGLLREARARVTFFVTGPVAVRYRSLVSEILSEGHELACHTFAHKPLDQYTPTTLADDLDKCLDALSATGAPAIGGFRAPILSMTSKTGWVYDVLAERGFGYSSSVLPAQNPLYGWPAFGGTPKLVGKVLEIPVSVGKTLGMTLPFASGVYFRVLPFWVVRRAVAACRRAGAPVVSYIHPYDFDTEQERFMHPGIHNSHFYNFLMYYNRAPAFGKLRRLLSLGLPVVTYRDFTARILSAKATSSGHPTM